MVTEIKKQDYLTTEEVIRREHSASSSARKVTTAPMYFPANATGNENVAPSNITVSSVNAYLSMEAGKAYRFISTVACNFLLSRGAATATGSDIYLPANTPIVISAGALWDRVNVVKVSGSANGIGQIVEVK